MEERGIRKVKLTSEMKNSFMQYAMSVIVSRALPVIVRTAHSSRK